MKNITSILKVLGGMVGVLVLIFILIVLARFAFCGPDSADVKVMKPMAEKISEYIVKNGIPKSLKDIPDLPYRLEGCEKSEEYRKGDNKGGWGKATKEDAENITKYEHCIIFINKRKINLIITNQIYPLEQEEYIYLKLENNASKTIANIDFAKIKNNFKVESPLKFMDFKSRGICTSFRQ